jgi:hypothetical protein
MQGFFEFSPEEMQRLAFRPVTQTVHISCRVPRNLIALRSRDEEAELSRAGS